MLPEQLIVLLNKMNIKIQPGRYLVLGGSGLIGSSVLSRLSDIDGVTVVSTYLSRDPRVHAKNITHIKADLRDRDTCKQIVNHSDYVFHLASNILLRSASEQDMVDKMTSNLLINSQVLEAAYCADLKRFLWISSSTAYPSKSVPLREDEIFGEDPPDKYFALGCMTRFIEKMCILYSSKMTKKVPITIVRPTCVYGENEGFDACHLLPFLVRSIIERDIIEVWSDGSAKRDLLYVDDTVEACFLALYHLGHELEVFNIGHGIGYSVNDIIDIVCELEDIHDLKVNRKLSIAQEERVLALDRSRDILNFVPSISMKDGIKRLIQEYKRSYV